MWLGGLYEVVKGNGIMIIYMILNINIIYRHSIVVRVDVVPNANRLIIEPITAKRSSSSVNSTISIEREQSMMKASSEEEAVVSCQLAASQFVVAVAKRQIW